jgi:hypothetical protein
MAKFVLIKGKQKTLVNVADYGVAMVLVTNNGKGTVTLDLGGQTIGPKSSIFTATSGVLNATADTDTDLTVEFMAGFPKSTT